MRIGPKSPEITPEALARAIESGEPIQILDVRTPSALASGAIDIGPPERFFNLPGSQILGLRSFGEDFVRPDAPVAVVCYRGNDSRLIARYLNGRGFRAASVSGGMNGWMGVVLGRELPAPDGFDRLIQFDRVGKGALGYLLVSDGEALVVDPPRNSSAYLAAAERCGARIIGVADTHVHADYVSGAPALSRALGVPYHLHPADSVSPYDGQAGRIPFSPIAEGQILRVGRGGIRVHHTPGHTEGSVTFRMGDDAALTGDFLFVRSVGRPDLGGKTAEWTPVLWESIERAKREWPPAICVLPAHYAAATEREPDRSVGKPFGELPPVNEALRAESGEAFAAWVSARAGSFPEAYRIIKTVNLGLVDAAPEELDQLEGGRNACALG